LRNYGCPPTKQTHEYTDIKLALTPKHYKTKAKKWWATIVATECSDFIQKIQ